MDSSPSILIFGHDQALLETRRLLLETAGLKAWTVSRLADVEKVTIAAPNGLLILCQSLSDEERSEALAMAHSCQPRMKSLVVLGAMPVSNLGQVDEVISSFDGPKALVATVSRLLRGDGSAALVRKSEGEFTTRAFSV